MNYKPTSHFHAVRNSLERSSTEIFMLCFKIILAASMLSLCTHSVCAQYLQLLPESVNPTYAAYQGSADWLVEQKDPKSHLHKHKTLKSLSLTQHDISVEEMRYVAGLDQLEFLGIGQELDPVSMNVDGLAVLRGCKNIQGLLLCKTNFKDSDLEFIQALPNIRHITIQGENTRDKSIPHKMTDKGMAFLCLAKTLETIEIESEGTFSDAAILDLISLPKLKSLKLGRTKCTDLALKTIASKMNLQELDIISPHFTDKYLEEFKKVSKIDRLNASRLVAD